jgi:hypothetical protein
VNAAPSSSRRPRFPWLYALPTGDLPSTIECERETYTLERTFKHDFFAATGLYRGPSNLAVLKMGRQSSFYGLPLAWIGRRLTRHEARLYQLAQDLPGVPGFIGTLAGDAGLLHDFVQGHPLERDERVGDAFFDQLADLLRTLHARDIAYVDLNKRQNILMGDNGRPYLIDFQISLHWPRRGLGRLWPVRWWLRRFQHGDWYHLYKHKRRLRPDLLTDQEREIVERASFLIRLHRWLTRPIVLLRRALLRRLRAKETMDVAGSSAK